MDPALLERKRVANRRALLLLGPMGGGAIVGTVGFGFQTPTPTAVLLATIGVLLFVPSAVALVVNQFIRRRITREMRAQGWVSETERHIREAKERVAAERELKKLGKA